MQNGYFKSFDGTRIYYEMSGPRNSGAPPLLFCCGLACSKLQWSYQMDYFKKKRAVVWADYRGHHLSDRPKKTAAITIENMSRDFLALLDELGIEEAVVLGHSMGVNVALELYRIAPHRVAAMVLANGGAKGPLESLFRTNAMQAIVPKIHGFQKKMPRAANFLWSMQGRSRLAAAIVGLLGFNPHLARKEDIKTYVRLVTEMDMAVTLQLLSDYERCDATAWLGKIKAPALILSGENDIIIPREAQEVLHQLIPGSQLAVVRNGSHCPQMDIPDLINIVIEKFLEKPYSSPGSMTSSTQSSRHGERS